MARPDLAQAPSASWRKLKIYFGNCWLRAFQTFSAGQQMELYVRNCHLRM